MNNKEYVDKVNQEQYPEKIEVPLDFPFCDLRGVIQNIWLGTSGSITYIESNEGAVRANHKHSSDFHATFIISGKIQYLEFSDEGKTVILDKIFSEKEMFFTRPGVYHRMVFLENTRMITVNNLVKSHDNYEKDIKRF